MGAARIYTLTTPYQAADLPLLKYAQSADVMTLTHPSYQDRDLSRTGNTSWTLTANTYGAGLAAPTGLGVTPNGHDGTKPDQTYNYVVTALSAATGEESVASASASAVNNALDSGVTGNIPKTNSLAWSAVTGAGTYAVYKGKNGVYGYVGSTPNVFFTDDNIQPDLGDTPPTDKQPFASSNFPGCVAYHQERRIFGMSLANPQTVWGTQTGNFHNMDSSVPTKADDALQFTLVSLQANEIRAIVPLNDLIVLTAGAEWRVTGGSDSVLTPTSISAKPQSYNGANHVRPIVSNNSVLFVQERGSRVRNLGYQFSSDSWIGEDLSILASHLFEGRYIVDWAFQQEPLKMIWAVMSDGAFLSFTYVQEQNVYAWARHDTNGFVEAIGSVAEGDQDSIYITVRRIVNGQTRRYVERMRPRLFTDANDSWFLDCGLAYSGAPIQVVGGLDHLEGCSVNALADGGFVTNLTVVNGKVDLGSPASFVVVGLGYVSEIQTLPLDRGEPTAQGKLKRVTRVDLKLDRSRGLFIGPLDPLVPLVELKQRIAEPYGSPTELKTGSFTQNTPSSWNEHGQIRVVQRYPLPANILSITPTVDIGG